MQGVGDFIDRQAAEITELDDPGLPLRQPRQPFERLVECFPAIAFGGVDEGDGFGFVQGDATLILAAALFPAASARVFDEHLAHQVRGHADKPGSVVPVIASLRGQPEIDLVDKRRRLKSMAGAFLTQIVTREPPQFGVDDGQELVGLGHRQNYARAALIVE